MSHVPTGMGILQVSKTVTHTHTPTVPIPVTRVGLEYPCYCLLLDMLSTGNHKVV
jgi:hypothetical protein